MSSPMNTFSNSLKNTSKNFLLNNYIRRRNNIPFNLKSNNTKNTCINNHFLSLFQLSNNINQTKNNFLYESEKSKSTKSKKLTSTNSPRSRNFKPNLKYNYQKSQNIQNPNKGIKVKSKKLYNNNFVPIKIYENNTVDKYNNNKKNLNINIISSNYCDKTINNEKFKNIKCSKISLSEKCHTSGINRTSRSNITYNFHNLNEKSNETSKKKGKSNPKIIDFDKQFHFFLNPKHQEENNNKNKENIKRNNNINRKYKKNKNLSNYVNKPFNMNKIVKEIFDVENCTINSIKDSTENNFLDLSEKIEIEKIKEECKNSRREKTNIGSKGDYCGLDENSYSNSQAGESTIIRRKEELDKLIVFTNKLIKLKN